MVSLLWPGVPMTRIPQRIRMVEVKSAYIAWSPPEKNVPHAGSREQGVSSLLNVSINNSFLTSHLPFCENKSKITYQKSMLTVPIKFKNVLPHNMLSIPTKKSKIFTWAACHIAIHLLADLLRVNIYFIPLLIMTDFFYNFLTLQKNVSLLLAHAIATTDLFDHFFLFEHPFIPL